MSRLRIVGIRALAIPAACAVARERLKAITAMLSQAWFAVNFPEGKCARGLSFSSAMTCSITA